MPTRSKKQIARSPAKPKLDRAKHARHHSAANQRNGESKQSRVIAMLRSPNGVTISAMMKATDWQQHSVRGFLAGVVRKRLRLKLDSTLLGSNRLYRIVDTPTKSTGSGKSKHRSA